MTAKIINKILKCGLGIQDILPLTVYKGESTVFKYHLLGVTALHSAGLSVNFAVSAGSHL